MHASRAGESSTSELCSLGHVVPGIGLEGREAPGSPCLVASFIGLAVHPGCREIPADRRAFFIDRASHLFADLPFEGDAPRRASRGADHHPPEVVEFSGEFGRYSPRCCIIRLSPVERCPIKRTAGAARQTRIWCLHSHFSSDPAFLSCSGPKFGAGISDAFVIDQAGDALYQAVFGKNQQDLAWKDSHCLLRCFPLTFLFSPKEKERGKR